MKHNLDNIFDVTPVETKQTDCSQIHTEPNNDSDVSNADFNAARYNIYELLNYGQDALINALDLAKQKEEPRAYEVVGGLLKQLSDMNTQLLDLSEKRNKLSSKKDTDKTTTITTNNAIFVGSTNELNKLLKQHNEVNDASR